MNPIEMAFAKLKTLLRQDPERTRDGLWRRIGALLDRFTPDECSNYLRAAGYARAGLLLVRARPNRTYARYKAPAFGGGVVGEITAIRVDLDRGFDRGLHGPAG